MVDEDDAGAEDVFADTEDDEEESSFVSADLDADGDVDSFDIMNDWNEMSDDDKASESGSVSQKPDKVDDEAEEGSFTDIDNLFTGIDEDTDAPEPLPKETLFQKIKKSHLRYSPLQCPAKWGTVCLKYTAIGCEKQRKFAAV